MSCPEVDQFLNAYCRERIEFFRELDSLIFAPDAPKQRHLLDRLEETLLDLMIARDMFAYDDRFDEVPAEYKDVMTLREYLKRSPRFKHHMNTAAQRYYRTSVVFDPTALEAISASEVTKVPIAAISHSPFNCFLVKLPEGSEFKYRGTEIPVTVAQILVIPNVSVTYTFFFQQEKEDYTAIQITLSIAQGGLLDLADLQIKCTKRLNDLIDRSHMKDNLNALQEQWIIDDYSQPVINFCWRVLLYVASKDADLAGTPREVRMTKTRKGMKFFPSPTLQKIEAGYRIGVGLRRFAIYKKQVKEAHESAGKVTPHMRRAHWRCQAYGPRTAQIYDLIWIAEVFINAKLVEEMVPTIQPID